MKQNLDEYKSQIEGFGQFFLNAYDETKQLSLKNKNIIICGMGGSGITGNYIKSLAIHYQSKTQVVVWKEYKLPSYISDKWFALVISYSGNTEETISMISELLHKGVETQIMTSGGELEKIAKKADIQMHKLSKGFQSRYAFPMIFGKVLKLFSYTLGFEMITKIQRDEILKFGNFEIQENLLNTVKSCKSKKIIVLSDNLLSPVALRFRCQLNENSKLVAQNYILPEFNHNGIVGLETIIKEDYIFFLISNDVYEHERTRIQKKFVEKYLKEKNVEVINISMNHTNLLIHILSITRDLDFLSFLIAQEMGTDPIKVESITQLKSKLREI